MVTCETVELLTIVVFDYFVYKQLHIEIHLESLHMLCFLRIYDHILALCESKRV